MVDRIARTILHLNSSLKIVWILYMVTAMNSPRLSVQGCSQPSWHSHPLEYIFYELSTNSINQRYSVLNLF